MTLPSSRSSSSSLSAAGFAVALACVPALALGDGFGNRYARDLVRAEPPSPLAWTCTEDDVWRIDAFDVTRGGELRVVLGPSSVVFGVHAKNVVWAAVIPDAPGSITGRASGAGAPGEHATSVWMRFHPSKLGELFPEQHVQGAGPKQALVWGRRLAAHKMSGGWYADGFPVVPFEKSIVLDCDTSEGKRRYFSLDDQNRSIELVQAFERRTLPPLAPMAAADAVDAFDRAWSKFDTTYAKFELRPDVDWDALKTRYRPLAESATTTYEAGAAIALLLEHLRDLHVYVRAGDESCPQYNRPRIANASFKGSKATIGDVCEPQKDVAWGRTKDGIGYIATFSLSEKEMVASFDRALDDLADTWGLIVDLRMNGGGDELLARDMSGRFCDKPRVYSQSRYRDDPKRRTSLGSPQPRTLEPRGPWRYVGPVVALQGQKTMSSAESFALMLAQCPSVTTMGDRTAGASANPERLELQGGLVVNVPRWNDLDPSGKPIEDVGVAPKIPVTAPPGGLSNDKDAIVEAALEKLRKTPKPQRRPGKKK